jgi:hypothetical protein
MWDLWWTKGHWDRYFPEYFVFPLSVSFYRCSFTWKKWKILIIHLLIFFTGLHNKPQGCGVSAARWFQTTSTHSTSLCSILILPSHLLPDVASGLFPASLYFTHVTHFSFLPWVLYAPPTPPSCSDHPNIRGRLCLLTFKLFINQFCPACCYCLRLKPKCALHEPVIEHQINANPCRDVRKEDRVWHCALGTCEHGVTVCTRYLWTRWDSVN